MSADGKDDPDKIDPDTPKKKSGVLDSVFGEDYNKVEVRFTIFAAILIAINNGMTNGICLSGLLVHNAPADDPLNPQTAMVSGVAAYVTNSGRFLASESWDAYRYNTMMFLSYMFGAWIAGILSPKAKPYAVDPMFGPAFMIGGTFLLGSSLLAVFEIETRFIWYLTISANAVQNGVASIYSANLIRCTLTGATTDIGLIIGQMLRGNFDKFGRGCVLATIVICFWVGGIISFYSVRAMQTKTLIVNAVVFYLVGVLNLVYLVTQLKISFAQAITGDWDWKDVLNKIKPDGDKQSLMDLFNELDHDGDGTLDMHELKKGLKGKVTIDELHALLQAADTDGDGEVDKQEWKELVDELYKEEENEPIPVGRRQSWFGRNRNEEEESPAAAAAAVAAEEVAA